MAFTIASNSGKIHYAINHFICDSASDIPDLPIDLIWVGSTAYIIDSGDTYMFNGQKKWVKIARGGSGGGSGKAATIQVGEVSTGAPGSEVTITNSGDENAAIFDFSIPRGDPFRIKATYPTKQDMDDDYDNPDIAVGDLVAIADGVNNATVYVKGDEEFVLFLEFDEPVAIQGEPGEKGEKGDKGDKGEAFIYTDFTEEQLEDLKGDTGVGIASASIDNVTYYLTLTYTDGTSETVETSLRGPQGIQGPTGADGSSISAVESVEIEDPQNPGEYVPGMRVTLTDENYYDFIIPTGPKGEDGEDGLGITNVVPKPDGTLEIYYGDSPDPVITPSLKGEKGEKGDSFKYTDFTPAELAALKGEDGAPGAPGERGPQGLQGPKGEGLTIKKVYEDQAAMLEDAGSSDLESGDMVITKDDGKLYVYDAESETFTYIIDLTTIETIEGPQGPQGEPFTYSDFTPEQLAALTGPKGDDGATADGVTINQAGNLVVHLDNGETIVTDIIPDELWMRIRNPYGYGSMSMNRKDNTTIGDYSTTFGNDGTATGDYSFAAGLGASATARTSAAMNYASASNDGAFAANRAYAKGNTSFAANSSQAIGEESFANGAFNHATGQGSHAEGHSTTASGQYAHTEGESNSASGKAAHAEGTATYAFGQQTHAEGRNAKATGEASHAEGYNSESVGVHSHAEGQNTKANGQASHSEGNQSIANSNQSHAEGSGTQSNGICSHAEGAGTNASGDYSHTEGGGTQTTGVYAHAEGEATIVMGKGSHAEGYHTNVSGNYSHAEGYTASAEGAYSHAEGESSKAIGDGSHAEGKNTKSIGNFSHAEGTNTQASGVNSHAEGIGTNALGTAQHISGKYNLIDQETAETYAVMVGNGTQSEPSNAYTLDWEGNERISGQGYIYDDQPVISIVSNGFETGGTADIQNIMDGDYILWDQHLDKMPADLDPGKGRLLQKRTSAQNQQYFILTEFGSNNIWIGSGGKSGTVTWKNIATAGGGGGSGSTVTITPTLSNGVQVATYMVDGVGGSIYGPALQDMDASELDELSSVLGSDSKIIVLDPLSDTLSYSNLDDLAIAISAQIEDIYLTKIDPVGSGTFSFNRTANSTIGTKSISFGGTASGDRAVSFDGGSATGADSFAAGNAATASGQGSFAMGNASTVASGPASFAFGNSATASADGAIAFNATASGRNAFAAGNQAEATGISSTALGQEVYAYGDYSFATGEDTQAVNQSSFAEGSHTLAKGRFSHVEGEHNEACGNYTHAEGSSNEVYGSYSHVEGVNNQTIGEACHAEGHSTTAGDSHVLNEATLYDSETVYMIGDCCIQFSAPWSQNLYQCIKNNTTGAWNSSNWVLYPGGVVGAHAEGRSTTASGEGAHAEGQSTTAEGAYSHAEGDDTEVRSRGAHVEGASNIIDGNCAFSHVEGCNNSLSSGGVAAHIEGYGHGEISANGAYGLHVGGKFAATPSVGGGYATYLEVIGKGTSDSARSNARTLDNQGNEELAGNLTINGAPTANAHAATVGMLKTLLDNFAPAYDSTVSYSANDVVVYEYTLYKANDATTGDWDATKWDKIRVTDLL